MLRNAFSGRGGAVNVGQGDDQQNTEHGEQQRVRPGGEIVGLLVGDRQHVEHGQVDGGPRQSAEVVGGDEGRERKEKARAAGSCSSSASGTDKGTALRGRHRAGAATIGSGPAGTARRRAPGSERNCTRLSVPED